MQCKNQYIEHLAILNTQQINLKRDIERIEEELEQLEADLAIEQHKLDHGELRPHRRACLSTKVYFMQENIMYLKKKKDENHKQIEGLKKIYSLLHFMNYNNL